MAIPDFQPIMLPLLQHLTDGKEHPNPETIEALAERFGLSDEELSELLPSGTQPIFVNRVAWANTYMKMARLVESPKRGVYRITQRGRELLQTNPPQINISTLGQYQEFVEFRSRKKKDKLATGAPDSDISATDDLTPEEHLSLAYTRIRQQLSQELLEKVVASPAHFFERLVVEPLVAMGYGGSRQDAGRTLGRSGDGGVDGVIKEDRLGLDVVYVQAKRWDGTVVGRPEIQKFAGALQGQRAKKGVFITTSSFSREAEDYVERINNKIVLIDGEHLTDLMIAFDIGVSWVQRYDIKRLDSDYFEEL